jgi:hypothetical protein
MSAAEASIHQALPGLGETTVTIASLQADTARRAAGG